MKYILAQDKSKYSLWQLKVAIGSLIDIGIKESDIYILLGTYGYDRQYNALFAKYESVNFYEYRNLSFRSYKPSVKPYLLWKFFEQFPEKSKEQWFLMDNDVILTKPFTEFGKKLVYCSDTYSYTGYDYLKSKGYTGKDFAKILDIDAGLISDDKGAGGAQFVFTNVGAHVWRWAYESCVTLHEALKRDLNRSEDGVRIQYWTAEMWAVLWSFWKHGFSTKIDKRLDFVFSTDSKKNADKVSIIHNAGVTGIEDKLLFHKGLYTTSFPPKDLEVDKDTANYIYYKNVIKHA